jgi:voltage-gated potassium channel
MEAPQSARVASARAVALERFDREVALPMFVLSLLIIPLLVIPLTVNLSHGLRNAFFAADWIVWALFAVEYLVRLYLSPKRGVFFRSHLLELAIVVLPFLRPLRVIRSARALRLLVSGRAAIFLFRGAKSGREILSKHNLHYLLLVAIALIVAAAAIMPELERGTPGANISNFADGIWWALATMATAGFTGLQPVSTAGRAVAVVLMIFGVGIFGLLAASLASFFLGRERESEIDPKIDEVLARLAAIERSIESLRGSQRPDGDPPT